MPQLRTAAFRHSRRSLGIHAFGPLLTFSAALDRAAACSKAADQNPPVINTRFATALGKEGLQTRHLRLRQPDQVAHWSVPLSRLNDAAIARAMCPDGSCSNDSHLNRQYVPIKTAFDAIAVKRVGADGLKARRRAAKSWRRIKHDCSSARSAQNP